MTIISCQALVIFTRIFSSFYYTIDLDNNHRNDYNECHRKHTGWITFLSLTTFSRVLCKFDMCKAKRKFLFTVNIAVLFSTVLMVVLLQLCLWTLIYDDDKLFHFRMPYDYKCQCTFKLKTANVFSEASSVWCVCSWENRDGKETCNGASEWLTDNDRIMFRHQIVLFSPCFSYALHLQNVGSSMAAVLG